jgi:hypothetical protein
MLPPALSMLPFSQPDAGVHPPVCTFFTSKVCKSYDAMSLEVCLPRLVRAFLQRGNVSFRQLVLMLNALFPFHAANGHVRVIFARILMEIIIKKDGIRDGNHRHGRDHSRQGSPLLRMHLVHGLLSKITRVSLRSTTPVTGTLIRVTVAHQNVSLAQAPGDPRAQMSDVSGAKASATLEASALPSSPLLEGEGSALPAVPIGCNSPLQAPEESCARMSDSTGAQGPATRGTSGRPAGREPPPSLPTQALEGEEFKPCVHDVRAGASETQGLIDLGPQHQPRMNADDLSRRYGSSPTRRRTQAQLVQKYTPNVEMALHVAPHLA